MLLSHPARPEADATKGKPGQGQPELCCGAADAGAGGGSGGGGGGLGRGGGGRLRAAGVWAPTAQEAKLPPAHSTVS